MSPSISDLNVENGSFKKKVLGLSLEPVSNPLRPN